MCLKQIAQPNNKDGDSCCFKSTAAQGHITLKVKGNAGF